ncbi:MAG TPA: hypothetical protein VGR06_26735 [Actinophytocola sp.]|uniref:LVIVD repeat-containing protein n=1 Tax=Actinophytocola sp. TaxID=1872138 RepID=UPI002E08F94F|nr:hypothetical protein [Actinophytocola sp.]
MRRARWVGVLVAVFTMASMMSAHADPGDHGSEPPAAPAQPGTARTLPLLATVNPGEGSNADVFGFKQHAYLASWIGKGCLSKGIRVYDLHNPRRPRLASVFADAASDPALAGTWSEKVIVQHVVTREFRGDLAVVSFQVCAGTSTPAFRGFGLYDVTNPDHPRKLALYATPGTRGSHEIWLGADRGKAYVYTAVIRSELLTSPDFDPVTNTATTPGTPDFRIIDVSDPTAPAQVGAWGAWKELGVSPTADGKLNFVHSVRVDDRLRVAYLSYWDLGTVILDISQPARPRFLGKTTPPQGATHSAFITNAGRLLVETHETDAGLPYFYDIADPAHPTLLGSLAPPGFEADTVHDPKVRGDRAYFSWYSLGVVVADIDRPASPRLEAQFVPRSDYVNPDFFCTEPCAQVWGVFVDRDYMLASDMNSGLYVLGLRPR